MTSPVRRRAGTNGIMAGIAGAALAVRYRVEPWLDRYEALYRALM